MDRSHFQKELLFREGRYLLRIQPMVTSGWTLRDWIVYVDRFGSWITCSAPRDPS